MRRTVLFTLTILGAAFGLIAGTGVFAALTDSADSGTNSVAAAALPSSADLQLATATGGQGQPVACGSYVENLSTPWITATDVEHGDSSSWIPFCLRNIGSQSVSLTLGVVDLTDVDVACTGDEATYDTTCGGDGLGELAASLYATFWERDCTTGALVTGTFRNGFLPELAATPTAYDSVAPGQVRCFEVAYQVYAPEAATQQTQQSDTATWRFRFSGQA